MSSTLSSLIKNNQIPATAGASIAQNNLCQIVADGYAYPCQVSDYAATPNIGNILAATSQTGQYALQNVNPSGTNTTFAQDSRGNIYVLLCQTSSGISVNKYSSLGAYVGTIALVSAAAQYQNIALLSNGNLLVTYGTGTAQYFAIVTPWLAIVTGPTAVNNSSTSQNIVSVALPGGGFACAYPVASATGIQFSVYSNVGAFLYSATITTSNAIDLGGVVLLSNGNIACVYQNTAGNVEFTIFTAIAGVAVAATSPGIAIGGVYPAITALASGYFCVSAIATGTAPQAAVYSNAGVIQGAVVTCGGSSGALPFGLVNDGVNFWVLSCTAGPIPIYNKITIAGVISSYTGTTFGSTNYSVIFVAYDGCGNIILFTSYTTTAKYSAFNVNLGVELVSAATIAAGETVSSPPNGMASLGDSAFIVNTTGTTSDAYLSIWKAVNTAILGPAQAAAAQGAPAQVVVASGYYPITKLKGTPSKAFAMKTVANIYGNNGTINGIGVGQQGM